MDFLDIKEATELKSAIWVITLNRIKMKVLEEIYYDYRYDALQRQFKDCKEFKMYYKGIHHPEKLTVKEDKQWKKIDHKLAVLTRHPEFDFDSVITK